MSAALEARIKALRRAGRLDAAVDAALAAHRPRRAAALAEEGLDWRRAAALWIRVEAWDAAITAWLNAGDPTEAGRVCLQTGRPAAALRHLPAAAVRLRAVAFATVGCWEAAAALLPDLAGPHRAAVLETVAIAEDAQAFASPLRLSEAEPDAPGAGWIGWQDDGALVAIRQLPDLPRFAAVLALFEPPLPGCVPLVRAERASLRIVTRRPGVALDRWWPTAPTARRARLIERVHAVLLAADARGCPHGMLLPADVRVLPGDRPMLDGWHRRHLDPVSGPWDATLDAATPPEIALGRPATDATDAWSLAHLLDRLGWPIDRAALDPEPTARPRLAQMRPWLDPHQTT